MTCSPVSFGSAQDIHWLRHCRRPARNINKDNCKESSAELHCIGRPGRGPLETMRKILILTVVAARLARAGAVRNHDADVCSSYGGGRPARPGRGR